MSRATVVVVALTVALAGCAAPKGEPAGPATGAAADPGGNPASTGGWASRTIQGLPAGSQLWDVAVSDSGLLVAVGTVGTGDDDGALPLMIWRSADGFTWEESFRRIEELVDPGDASGLPSPSAVVAHPVGFTVVASTCPDRCRPFALYSADGIEWQEAAIPVRPPGGQDTSAAPARGGGATSVVGGRRLIRGTPSFTLEGAEVLDVVAAGGRLVAVGWTQGDGYATAHAVWHSDDGGRTWRQLPEAAIPQDTTDQNELDKVVFAGDRLVAGGGNRCCHGNAVGEVWVADTTGERWRPVPFPDGASVTIDELVVTTDAVDIVGGSPVDSGEEPALWRLSPQDRWERLSAPPLPGRLLAHPGGLMLVGSEPTGTFGLRLTLFRSPDGRQFRLSKTSDPRQALEVELALMVGERLLAYVTAGEGDDVQHLLFTAGQHERADPDGRGVWAARLRPSPVLFGEGVRVPGDKDRFVDVTPPQKSPAELVVDAYVVDPDHGWVLLADSEAKGHRLLLTTDGGRRWAASLLDTGADTPRWLSFIDREHGWMATLPATPGRYPPTSSLYRTADGGRTWSGPTTIPGCGPVHFDTVLHGWLADPSFSEGCGDGLYETLDGGRTWTEREIARPPPGTPALFVRYALPRLTSRVLPVGLIEGERSRATFFVSDDRGETWSSAGSIDLPGGERYPHASVADADAWWAADSEGTVVAVTTDGGGRWRKVRPAGIQGRWMSLEAIDERRAWAIEANAAGVRIMQTDDGGAHWRPLLEE